MSKSQEQPQPSSKSGARVPPQNLDAERSVLGGILLESSAFDEVHELVKPTDFYREAHRKVFEAMVALSTRSEPIDRVTVKDEIGRLGYFASIGGDDFLDMLDKVVPVSTNVACYARIVAEKALCRRVIEAAQNIARDGFESAGEAREFAESAEMRILAATAVQSDSGGFVSVGASIAELQKVISASYERNTSLTGAPTGLTALDDLCGGYQASDLVVVGARPSMGKSALMLDGCRAIAKAPAPAGGTVAMFSLEMPRIQQMLRLAAAEARIELIKLRNGSCTEADFARLMDAFKTIEAMPIEIDDTGHRSLSQIRAASRRLAKKLVGTPRPLRAIFVDYLQLMDHGQAPGEREDQAISRTTNGLKALAKELAVPVIVLSQLNRSVEHRPDKRPRPADLRECGSLEQDADLILFPYRGGDIYGDQDVPKGEADIIIGKQRMGALGAARVAFLGRFTTFVDLEQADGRPVQSGLKFTGHRPPPHTDEDAA